jgi:hypothetical protein
MGDIHKSFSLGVLASGVARILKRMRGRVNPIY